LNWGEQVKSSIK